MKKSLLPLLLAAALLGGCSGQSAPEQPGRLEIYVSADGDDSGDGSMERPLRTLTAARDKLRAERNGKAATVYLRGGTYSIEESFVLSEADADTVYAAYPGETVVLTGATAFDGSLFHLAENSDRLAEGAVGKVWSYSIEDDSIDLGAIPREIPGQPAEPPAPTVMLDETICVPARWPNADAAEAFIRPAWLERGGFSPSENSNQYAPGTTEYIAPEDYVFQESPIFGYNDERIDSWVQEDDAFLYGYYYYDWAASNLKIQSIHPEKKLIEAAYPHTYGTRETAQFYGFNLLCELDCEGEYYIDRAARVLYVYFDAPMAGRTVRVAALRAPLVTVEGAENIRIENMTFDMSFETAVSFENSSACALAGCTLKNIGTNAVTVDAGCTGVTIENCTIFDTGHGGVVLDGGDFDTLRPGNNAVVGCEIYNTSRVVRTYTPAITMNGVGQRAAGNYIHDLPHSAILFWGNDMLIECNEFENILYETGDAGVIYSGRDWTFRGNIIRYNFIHDIPNVSSWTSGIYLDDAMSSAEIYGNLFVNMADLSMMIGGGRDHRIHDNTHINVRRVFSFDARTFDEWFRHCLPTLAERLAAKPVTNEFWTAKYPTLAACAGHVDIALTLTASALAEPDLNNPMYPAGNAISGERLIRANRGTIHQLVSRYGEVRQSRNFGADEALTEPAVAALTEALHGNMTEESVRSATEAFLAAVGYE